MSTWTKERIEKMIAEGVEESLTLDYKRAASLGKSDSTQRPEENGFAAVETV